MRTRIKICGLRHPQDALAAASAGADAIGLVFYAPSPRAVSFDEAVAVAAALPAFVANVALVLDAGTDYVHEIMRCVKPDMLQFHGNESGEFCRSFGLPYLKAVPMRNGTKLADFAQEYADARGLLLDSHAPGEAGGRGEVFDWTRINERAGPPVILAGGLHAGNVAAAVRSVRPYAVDVSSGVESAPGVKDAGRIKQFIEAVQRTDSE